MSEKPKLTSEQLSLLMMASKDREIRQTSVPSKRQVRNLVERRQGHRLTSKRMQQILRQTPNGVRAAYQTPKQAAAGHQGIKVPKPHAFWKEGLDETTRNVGPSDLDQNYHSGKNTTSVRGY